MLDDPVQVQSPSLETNQHVTNPVPLAPLTADRHGLLRDRHADSGRTAWGFRLDGPTDTSDYLAFVLVSELLEYTSPPCTCPGSGCGRGPLASRVNRTGNPFDVARDSMLVIEAGHPADASPEQLTTCIHLALTSLAQDDQLDDLVRRTVEGVALDLVSSTDSLLSRASWACVDTATFKGTRRFAEIPERLKSVGVEDVREGLRRLTVEPSCRLTSSPEEGI